MPLIAMPREMGSLGKDVASTIAARLGKPVVHHEIIGHLANKMRLRKSHVLRFLDGKASIWEQFTTDKTSLSIYTADETLALAESDNVSVIRGWGSAHLLRPIQHVICVRVCAPMKVRVQRMMERLNSDDLGKVERLVDQNDESARAVMRRHFHIDTRDINEYDMGFNTDRVSVAQCVDEIVDVVKSVQFAETDASRATLRDIALAHHVRAALRTHGSTSHCSVRVTAEGGRVELRGTVDQIEQSEACSDIAKRIKGVRVIENHLHVAETGRSGHG